MCLILIAYRYDPGCELLVAANRDEFYQRPTAPLAFWDDAPEVLAGRDLQAGGTWMGMTRGGRFAALTNYRDPDQLLPNALSRGRLVSDYLQGGQTVSELLEWLPTVADRYNGFNLLLGDATGLYCYSSRIGQSQKLQPGLYGLSNHLLNSPWPKLKRGLARLRRLLEDQPDPASEKLLEILTDRTLAPDHELPNTGIPLDWERWLSPIFIEAPGYGTRSSTVLRVDQRGHVKITETNWVDGTGREFQLSWPTRLQ